MKMILARVEGEVFWGVERMEEEEKRKAQDARF